MLDDGRFQQIEYHTRNKADHAHQDVVDANVVILEYQGSKD